MANYPVKYLLLLYLGCFWMRVLEAPRNSQDPLTKATLRSLYVGLSLRSSAYSSGVVGCLGTNVGVASRLTRFQDHECRHTNVKPLSAYRKPSTLSQEGSRSWVPPRLRWTVVFPGDIKGYPETLNRILGNFDSSLWSL